ncbi:hypothetical protein Misp01_82130 [Microtetraspora sp. NBRC 13810]|uniref:hypothetical protein n=1 Tax=Microtetraspora sp. NBRC 13810 TaxID=3030990 RepID=UPI0024A1EED9|nr:hypothetical protein [Microtetraspora sp. NBRC 13810]GLW13085.1 hypothetical protein Misp01_82130 [Microtetraspora sp. NBRC 13810]
MSDQTVASGLALIGAQPLPGLPASHAAHVAALESNAGHYDRLLGDSRQASLRAQGNAGAAAEAINGNVAGIDGRLAQNRALSSIGGGVMRTVGSFCEWIQSNWKAIAVAAAAGGAFLVTPAGRALLVRLRGLAAKVQEMLRSGVRQLAQIFKALTDKITGAKKRLAESQARSRVQTDMAERFPPAAPRTPRAQAADGVASARQRLKMAERALAERRKVLDAIDSTIWQARATARSRSGSDIHWRFYQRFGVRDHPLLYTDELAKMRPYAEALGKMDRLGTGQVRRYLDDADKVLSESGSIVRVNKLDMPPGMAETSAQASWLRSVSDGLDRRLARAQDRMDGYAEYVVMPDGSSVRVSHPGDKARLLGGRPG